MVVVECLARKELAADVRIVLAKEKDEEMLLLNFRYVAWITAADHKTSQ